MKKILLLAALLLTALATQAQTPSFIYHTPLNMWYHSVNIDSLVRLSGTDTADYPASTSKGCFMFQLSDAQYYYSDGVKWSTMGLSDSDLDAKLDARSVAIIPPLVSTGDSTLEFKPSALSSAAIKYVGSDGTTFGTRTPSQTLSDIGGLSKFMSALKSWDSLASTSIYFNTSNLNPPDGTNYANGFFIPYSNITNVGSEIMTTPATGAFSWRVMLGGVWQPYHTAATVESLTAYLLKSDSASYVTIQRLKDSLSAMRANASATYATKSEVSAVGSPLWDSPNSPMVNPSGTAGADLQFQLSSLPYTSTVSSAAFASSVDNILIRIKFTYIIAVPATASAHIGISIDGGAIQNVTGTLATGEQNGVVQIDLTNEVTNNQLRMSATNNGTLQAFGDLTGVDLSQNLTIKVYYNQATVAPVGNEAALQPFTVEVEDIPTAN